MAWGAKYDTFPNMSGTESEFDINFQMEANSEIHF